MLDLSYKGGLTELSRAETYHCRRSIALVASLLPIDLKLDLIPVSTVRQGGVGKITHLEMNLSRLHSAVTSWHESRVLR